MHDFTVIKMTIASFVSAGGYLIRYEINPPRIKEGGRSFITKHYSFNYKISELHSNHYRNVSRDPWEIVADPLGSADHT